MLHQVFSSFVKKIVQHLLPLRKLDICSLAFFFFVTNEIFWFLNTLHYFWKASFINSLPFWICEYKNRWSFLFFMWSYKKSKAKQTTQSIPIKSLSLISVFFFYPDAKNLGHVIIHQLQWLLLFTMKHDLPYCVLLWGKWVYLYKFL